MIDKRVIRPSTKYDPAMPSKKARKLGRPPATSSVETRQRILDVARRLFAELGWGVTTNKQVADEAGVTSAAIYHYFDSKLDMFLAVYDDAQALITSRFLEATDPYETFAAQFAAVLETAHEMNGDDPSLARFLGSARVDATRHPEISKGIARRRHAGNEIVARLVETGITTGEIEIGRRAEVTAFLRSALTGLNDAVSSDQDLHRTAVDAFLLLLDGRLFEPPPSKNGARRRTAASASRKR